MAVSKKKNYDLNNMMGLDLFLFTGALGKHPQVSGSLKKQALRTHPLMAWDVIGLKQVQSAQAHARKADLDHLLALAVKYSWVTDLEALLSKDYQALVLTDATQKITWTNTGFVEMTGYASGAMRGKLPNTLQGPATSAAAKERIRRKLAERIPFTETLVNYRKDKTPYDCLISISPLVNTSGEITHFIALESEACPREL